MADPKAETPTPSSSSSPSPSSSSSKISSEINYKHGNAEFSGPKFHFPNPPESTNPDPATLRDQWRFAIRQYSRWYSHAWGTAILAGVSFFALGWIIKGSNPLPSRRDESPSSSPTPSATSSDSKEPRP